MSLGINAQDACYYRVSWSIKLDKSLNIVDNNQKYINKDEIFVFKVKKDNIEDNIEDNYFLHFDNENEKTELKYFSISEEQKASKNEPQVLEKTLPIMDIRPNFEISERNKLIERLKYWVLIS